MTYSTVQCVCTPTCVHHWWVRQTNCCLSLRVAAACAAAASRNVSRCAMPRMRWRISEPTFSDVIAFRIWNELILHYRDPATSCLFFSLFVCLRHYQWWANLKSNLALKSQVFQEKDVNYLVKSQIPIFPQISNLLTANLKPNLYHYIHLDSPYTARHLYCQF